MIEDFTHLADYFCKACGSHFGPVVAFKNRPYLDDGRMLVLTGVARCHRCGRPIHWHGESTTVDSVRSLQTSTERGKIEAHG